MSTNIRVDVTLQRLQNQSRQATEQNRSERQQREEGLLQSAAPQTVANSPASQREATGARRESPFDRRRPAAQRLEDGSTMGVEYTTQVIPASPSATFRVTVGPPGHLASVQATVLEPSTAAASNLPPTTDTDSASGDAILGFLTTGPNGYTTQYPCGYTFQSGTGTPPTSSWTEYTLPRVVTQTFTDHHSYLLPIGNKSCIFVFVYSKLRVLTVYERYGRTDRVSVNARETSSGCGLAPGTYYDRESTFLVSDTLDHIEERQRYEVLAFFVDENSVRTLDVPEALDTAMRALHPPMEVNSTAEMLTSSEYTRYEFAEVAGVTDEPQNYNGPVTYGYSTIPIFSDAVHQQGSLHGDYQNVNSRNDVLAKQFGMGYLHQDTHDGDFFTPAVFRFIRSAMNLSTSNAQLYDYMRSTYFSRAPKRYLAPCVIKSSCAEQELVGFDETTTAPVDIDTPVPDGDFRRKAKYDVALNGAFDYEVVFGWDWDDPKYCAQQLKALGFTSADLKP